MGLRWPAGPSMEGLPSAACYALRHRMTMQVQAHSCTGTRPGIGVLQRAETLSGLCQPKCVHAALSAYNSPKPTPSTLATNGPLR